MALAIVIKEIIKISNGLGLYWIFMSAKICGAERGGGYSFSLSVVLACPRYFYSHGIIVDVVQKLTFCNISVITEDIYLKLGTLILFTIQRAIHIIKGDN